jgi:hypothetical protein
MKKHAAFCIAKHEYASPVSLAAVYAATGHNEDALRWVQSAIHNGDGALVWLRVDPRFDGLRNDAQLQKMLLSLESPSHQTS